MTTRQDSAIEGQRDQWGGDFGGTDETLLTEDRERPIMVDRFPASFKAFYFSAGRERARTWCWV